VVLDVDFAVGGGEDDVFGAALELEVAFGFDGGGGLVVDDFVGVDDVVLVVDDDLRRSGWRYRRLRVCWRASQRTGVPVWGRGSGLAMGRSC